jgi:hypothetical protein
MISHPPSTLLFIYLHPFTKPFTVINIVGNVTVGNMTVGEVTRPRAFPFILTDNSQSVHVMYTNMLSCER